MDRTICEAIRSRGLGSSGPKNKLVHHFDAFSDRFDLTKGGGSQKHMVRGSRIRVVRRK